MHFTIRNGFEVNFANSGGSEESEQVPGVRSPCACGDGPVLLPPHTTAAVAEPANGRSKWRQRRRPHTTEQGFVCLWNCSVGSRLSGTGCRRLVSSFLGPAVAVLEGKGVTPSSLCPSATQPPQTGAILGRVIPAFRVSPCSPGVLKIWQFSI